MGINWLICCVLSAATALADSVGGISNETNLDGLDLFSPKADAPYVPYSLLNHTSTYDEEQARFD
jgi:hypothetical protein